MSNKNTFYFSHDANAHEDDKIVCLMSEYGSQGYGWWWILVEVLFQQENCRIDMSKKSTIPYLCRMLWDIEPDKVLPFVNSLVEYDLLERQGDFVFSPSLLRRNQKLQDLREKKKAAANARWSKEKEPDKTTSNGIDVIKKENKWVEFRSELKANDRYSMASVEVMDREREACLNWLASTGKVKKDYKAFYRNWLMKVIEDKGLKNNNQMVY